MSPALACGEELLPARVPLGPVADELAVIVGSSTQYVLKAQDLDRTLVPRGKRVAFTVDSTEKFLARHGYQAVWIDRFTHEVIDPRTGAAL